MLKLLPLLLALNASAASPITAKPLRVLPYGVPDAALTVLATPADASINLWSLETGKQLAHIEVPVIPKKTANDNNQFTIHSVRPDLKLLLVSVEHANSSRLDRISTQFFLVSTGDAPTVKKIWSIEGPCAAQGGHAGCTGIGRFSASSYIDTRNPFVHLFVRKHFAGNDRRGWVSLVFGFDGRKLFENETVYENDALVKGVEKEYGSGKLQPEITVDAQSCIVKLGGKQLSFLDECVGDDNPNFSDDFTRASKLYGDTYKTWDLATGALLQKLTPEPSKDWNERMWAESPDRRIVVHQRTSAAKDTELQVWDGATGKLLRVLNGPELHDLYQLRTDGRRVLFMRNAPSYSAYLVDLGLSDAPSAPAAPAAAKIDVDALPAVAAKLDPEAFAIVIGVEKYRQAGVPAVDYAARDAKTMAAYLGAMGFDSKNVAVLTDAQAGKVDFDKYFGKWLKNRVGPKSRVFVYYAGHGAPNPTTGAGYLMPYEADPSYLDETAYPVTQLYAELAKLPTKDVTVVLDACFSGQGERSLIAKGTRPLVAMQKTRGPENAAVIAAASGSQISASDHEARHGLLTYHLLAGLHGGADDNGDGKITTAELFKYAGPAVERAAKLQNVEQTPTVSGENGLAGARIWTTLKKP